MTDAGQQTEPIQTEPKNMNVSGTIKIENKTKPTSLIKRTKEKLIDCGKDKRFELYWDYTTNKSGTQQFTFTGKEMGQNFWSEKEKNKIKVGDLVIFLKKGHPNHKYKARVHSKTGLISKLEALDKGIIQELPKVPDTYTLKFIAPPVIAQKRIKKEKGVSPDNIEKIPGYRFFFCGKATENKKKKSIFDPDYLYNKNDLKKLVKREMKKGFVKKLDWRIDRIEAKYTDVKKDPITGNPIAPDKIIDTPKDYKIKYQIAEVELVEVSNPVCLHKNKPNEVHKIRALVHIRLVKVEKGKQVTDAEGVMSVMDCRNHKKRIVELIDDFREESAKNAENFSIYLGDKLNQKFAKNQYGEMKFYQDKGKQEYLDEIEINKKREEKRKKESGEVDIGEPSSAAEAKATIHNWKRQGRQEALLKKEGFDKLEKNAEEEKKEGDWV